ncbi:hypothetical protein HAX54_016870 [Datura stramonium]|uniref:At1g61320/AtMIF1 LRR domain-containing protein n=1 Tax=Datura stramonium TaxID=4076 RepID=A0ABS8RJ03_DATST|nr:hypothetical protein [Datura stramonium]
MTEIIEDRISGLPIHIIHDILRRISKYGLKEAARTSILSKTWISIWRSRSDVIINQYTHKSIMNNLENFVKFVDDSLRPYAEQNLSIETLRLLGLGGHPELASHIDRWLNLAIQLNVKSLGIWPGYALNYSIPDAIYAAKTLTELSLHGCNFGIDQDHNNNGTNKLQRLISTCPFIRDLQIGNCTGIRHLRVSGLVNLENLELSSCEGLVKVVIQAPNLQKFVYVGAPLFKRQKTREVQLLPCTVDILDGYKTLQILKLEASTMTDQEFEYQLSKFSALEVLELTRCYQIKKIKVVNEKLKRFFLWHWSNLEQVSMLQSPNLTDFDFQSDKTCMPFSTMDPSNLKQARINFYLLPDFSDSYNFGDVDTIWYNNLQYFLQKFNYSKGLILVIFCKKYWSILIYEDPSEIVVPPTRQLELCIKNPSMHLESFTDDLMSWRPNKMSIVACPESKIVQVLDETIITRHREKQNGRLNEVTNHKGATYEDNGTCPWYSWLKSTSLIDRITTLMFKWEELPRYQFR